MEDYPSDDSRSFLSAQMTNEPELPLWSHFEFNDSLTNWSDPFPDSLEVKNEKNEVSYTSVEMTNSPGNQHHLNQIETSEASCLAKSGGGRVKLTPDQIREKKKQSDYRYRQRKKRTTAELAAENIRLKVENDKLNAENKRLKGFTEFRTCQGQLSAEALQREDTCIVESNSNQLDHPSVSVQVNGLEMNELHNLHKKIPIYAVATNDDATESQKNSRTGTCHDSTTIKLLMKEIDEDEQSSVRFSDFTGLDGERIKIGKYNFPLSLRHVVERIIACHGDVSATSKMNLSVVEATYILFCASLKEMGDLQLEEVSKDRILKWRDTIKDALRINFKVDFAMDHLKKIVHAYIGLLERQKLENVAIRISKLVADLNAERDEHAKICEQSKVYMDAANELNGKPISAGLF